MDDNLKIKVEELEQQIAALRNVVNFNKLPAMTRFDANVNISPQVRLRLEPTEAAGVLATRVGEFLLLNERLFYSPNIGVWEPVGFTEPYTATLAASTNNMSLTTTSNGRANYVLLNNTAGASIDLTGIAGLAASPPLSDGFQLLILNISASNIVVKHSSVSSSLGNRIFTTTAADVTLAQHSFMRLVLRNDASRTNWQQV